MKNDGRRVLRVEREIQQCLSTLLINQYQGEYPGFLTVGQVKLTGDLRAGKVHLSVFGGDASPADGSAQIAVSGDANLEKWLAFLNYNVTEIQGNVARQLGLRYCPKLEFVKDNSSEKIMHIEKMLHGLQPQVEPTKKPTEG